MARPLHTAGFEVSAPTLTGVGDRRHLADCGVDLETHIQDIAGLLFCEDITDAVLVDHSYGGMVVTGAASTAPERIRLLVYMTPTSPTVARARPISGRWRCGPRSWLARPAAGRPGRPLPRR